MGTDLRVRLYLNGGKIRMGAADMDTARQIAAFADGKSLKGGVKRTAEITAAFFQLPPVIQFQFRESGFRQNLSAVGDHMKRGNAMFQIFKKPGDFRG